MLRTQNAVNSPSPPSTVIVVRNTIRITRMNLDTRNTKTPFLTGSRIARRRYARSSDSAAFDLFAQGLHQVGNARQVRMNLERATEHIERALFVAELLQDHAEPGHGAEVERLDRQ